MMIDQDILQRLSATLEQRKSAPPDSSYVSSLHTKGLDTICKKVAEEAAETIMAAKDGDLRQIVYEVTDLWFHSMVLLSYFGLSSDDILLEMRRREGISGIDEKNSREA